MKRGLLTQSRIPILVFPTIALRFLTVPFVGLIIQTETSRKKLPATHNFNQS